VECGKKRKVTGMGLRAKSIAYKLSRKDGFALLLGCYVRESLQLTMGYEVKAPAGASSIEYSASSIANP
jgi:hypothetical protein